MLAQACCEAPWRIGDQVSGDDTRIAALPTDALLALLEQAPAAVPALAAMWCAIAGLIPGTPRVPARTLYAEYRAWLATTQYDRPHTMADLQLWGAHMKAHYRKGRGKRGWFYYVTRGV